ncbi:MAG TPA: glycosyltransferase [Solirubrobacteraceae bacterium]|nr:glycosyltransferase [Solirubrobacteraceae bacterium]
MGQISVVVPIYDVEDYLEDCLRSLVRQTVGDFEAILVDDGSTDASAAIAERFAATDGRFRLLRQPNGGLSRARNAGIDAASGDYLAFLDSDDVLPPNAYELLLGTLARTGSDFATGNVHRLTAAGCTQAPFVASAFARTRERTHVRRFAPLLDDRTAWNKLWRRSFWDGCELRFPDGRLHEDIPVVLPAHFRAASVDVVHAPVYHYRVREAGALSITQRRHELRALRDRLAAVEHVHGFITERESVRQRRRYERTVVAQDLRYHLDLLPDADDEYRELFMQWTAAFLDGCARKVCDDLPAIDRVKYHLVRRGRLDDLLELIQFQREDALSTPPRRRRGRYYGNYPVQAVPRAAVRLGRRDRELALTAQLESVRFELGRLVLTGHGYVNSLGAPSPEVQAFEVAAVRAGARRALRMRFSPRRLATAPTRRSDLEPRLRWAGFRATLDPKTLIEDGAARWELFAFARSGGLRRRRAVFAVDEPQAADIRAGKALVRAAVTASGRATVTVAERWVCVERHRRIGNGIVELAGTARLDPSAAEPELELVRAADGARVRFPIAVAGWTFRVQVMLSELRLAAGGVDGDAVWDMAVIAGLQRPLLSMSEELSGAVWRAGARDMALERAADGGGRLLESELPQRRDGVAVDGALAFPAWPASPSTSLS